MTTDEKIYLISGIEFGLNDDTSLLEDDKITQFFKDAQVTNIIAIREINADIDKLTLESGFGDEGVQKEREAKLKELTEKKVKLFSDIVIHLGDFTSQQMAEFYSVILKPARTPLPEGFDFMEIKKSVQSAVLADFFLTMVANGQSMFAALQN